MGAPNFWKTFGEALTLSAQSRGIWAYCPWFLGLVILTGFGIGFLGILFNSNFLKADTVAALAAMMATAGFLGAVSIGCMNQIFTTLDDSLFSDYLQSAKAFDQFLAWPQIVYLIQATYFVLCSLSILLVCVIDENHIRVFSLSVMSVGTVYVANKTWRLIDLLRILAWHKQDYAKELAQAQREQ